MTRCDTNHDRLHFLVVWTGQTVEVLAMPSGLRIIVALESNCGHFRRISLGVHAWARRHGAVVVNLTSAECTPGVVVRGDVILTHARRPERQLELAAYPVPVVQITSQGRPLHLPAVVPDNRRVGAMAEGHFRDLGRRRLAVMACGSHWFSTERLAGFTASAAARGLGVEALMHDQLTDRLGRSDEPAGLYVTCDQVARGAVQRLLDAGIAVPQQVAVVGTDNDSYTVNTCAVALTSIDLDSERIGWEAAALGSRLAGGQARPAGPVLIPPRGLVARASSDTAMIGPPHVVAAIHLLRDQAHRGGTVEDVLHQLPLSRRTLERGIREVLGRAPAEELIRVRMMIAQRMLAQPEVAIRAVARDSGYSGLRPFLRAFRRVIGCTPGEWRQRHLLRRQSEHPSAEQEPV